jgi:hypothetical protein
MAIINKNNEMSIQRARDPTSESKKSLMAANRRRRVCLIEMVFSCFMRDDSNRQHSPLILRRVPFHLYGFRENVDTPTVLPVVLGLIHLLGATHTQMPKLTQSRSLSCEINIWIPSLLLTASRLSD